MMELIKSRGDTHREREKTVLLRTKKIESWGGIKKSLVSQKNKMSSYFCCIWTST